MHLSVVVPVYNEAENLEAFAAELWDELGNDTEVVFVDDGSDDGSAALLAELADRYGPTTVVRLDRNRGQGAALDAGFRHARGDFLVTMDADRQFRPADIPALVAELEDGADVVCGWRRNRGSVDGWRTVPSAVFNRLARWATGDDITDFGSGMVGLRREVAEDLRLGAEYHRVLPVLASLEGYTVREAPVEVRERWRGTSKYGIRRLYRGLRDLLRVIAGRRPGEPDYAVEHVATSDGRGR